MAFPIYAQTLEYKVKTDVKAAVDGENSIRLEKREGLVCSSLQTLAVAKES